MFACLYSPSIPRDELETLARAFSPRIETPGESLVLLDVSGLGRLLGEPRVIAEELQRAAAEAVTSTTTVVAVAGTRVSAQLLARASSAIVVIEPGREAAALAPLPLGALTPLGAPPDLLATLDRWGLRTLGAYAGLPSIRLASRIGQHGLSWQRIARGEDPRPIIPVPVEERFEEMLDLEWPIEGVEPLAFVLGRLLDPLCARLERRDRAVAAIELRLRLAASRTWQLRRLELPAPMRDPRTLRTLLCLDLEGRPLGAGEAGVAGGPGGASESIDRVGLFVEPTPGRVAQFSLLSRPTVAPEAVATLMARLRALMGQDRCGITRLLDTHRPGAFGMGDFTVAGPGSGPRAGPPLRAGASGLSPPFTPASTLGLTPGPANGQTEGPATVRALRRLRHPIPARVIVDGGRPVRVATDRRGWSGGRVLWCSGPWRASGDWWKPETARADHAPYSWREWDVALSDGGHYRIHEDRQHAHWFIDAILD